MKIDIKAYRDSDFLIIDVIDNGMGIEEGILDKIFETRNVNKFSTVGLNNIKERIRLHFGEGYGMKIISEVNKGTCVKIILPYALNEGGKLDVQNNDC